MQRLHFSWPFYPALLVVSLMLIELVALAIRTGQL